MAKRVCLEDEQLKFEQEKACDLIRELLATHLFLAAKCRVEEKFAVGFALTFERDAHSTIVKAKISYSKKYSEVIEGTASPYEQLEMSPTAEAMVSLVEAEVESMFGPRPSSEP
jgi:hypothetical protein